MRFKRIGEFIDGVADSALLIPLTPLPFFAVVGGAMMVNGVQKDKPTTTSIEITTKYNNDHEVLRCVGKTMLRVQNAHEKPIIVPVQNCDTSALKLGR